MLSATYLGCDFAIRSLGTRSRNLFAGETHPLNVKLYRLVHFTLDLLAGVAVATQPGKSGE